MSHAPRFRQIIRVHPTGAQAHHGVLRFGPHRARCALGAAGVTKAKKEGDRATPLGVFPLRQFWYRPDRLESPETTFETHQILIKSGWCDAPTHSAYNRPIRRPFAASHERLWRHDGLYDGFFTLGHNDDPPQAGQGSAIFLHLQKKNFQPTLGCIAVSFATLRFIVRHARPGCLVEITEGAR